MVEIIPFFSSSTLFFSIYFYFLFCFFFYSPSSFSSLSVSAPLPPSSSIPLIHFLSPPSNPLSVFSLLPQTPYPFSLSSLKPLIRFLFPPSNTLSVFFFLPHLSLPPPSPSPFSLFSLAIFPLHLPFPSLSHLSYSVPSKSPTSHPPFPLSLIFPNHLCVSLFAIFLFFSFLPILPFPCISPLTYPSPLCLTFSSLVPLPLRLFLSVILPLLSFTPF